MNEICLYSGSTEYPCCHLPTNLPLAVNERESFVEIGDGLDPVVCRCWMTSGQFAALPSGVRAGTAAIGVRMRGTANAYPAGATQSLGDRTLTMAAAFYLVKATPARCGLDVNILECYFATAAHWWKFRSVNRAYNVLNLQRDKFIVGATSSTAAVPYSTVIYEIANDIGLTLATPYSGSLMPFTPSAAPHNLILDYVPGQIALGRVLRPLGTQIQANPHGASMVYTLIAFDHTDTSERDDLNALAAVVAVDGGTADNLGAGIAPATLTILAPKWPVQDIESGSGSTSWSKYTSFSSNNPAGTSGPMGDDVLFLDHFDIGSGNTFPASPTLSTIASERATRYWARALIPHRTYVFAGGYPLVPGKTIRKVRLSMDLDGWFTTVVCHGFYQSARADWQMVLEHGKAPSFPEHALSAVNTFPRDDGAMDTHAEPPHVLLPCLVTKIDGSAGTVSTACAFTYSYTDIHGTELVSAANKQQPQWNRPAKGAMLEGEHGTYYRDATGAPVLWEVDEQPDKAACA